MRISDQALQRSGGGAVPSRPLADVPAAHSSHVDKVMPYMHRMSALFLAGAGVYLVCYWLFIAGLQASSGPSTRRHS